MSYIKEKETILDIIASYNNINDMIADKKSTHKGMRFKVEDGLLTITYNRCFAFNNPFVRQCRGIVIDPKTGKILCLPFPKFMNLGAKHSAKVNTDNCIVQRKLDGSLIKLYSIPNDGWQWATNNRSKCDEKFVSMINDCLPEGYDEWLTTANPSYTYLFELIHKDNKVVVNYTENKLSLLAVYNRDTLDEVLGVETPFPVVEELDISFEQVEENLKTMTEDEGYVLIDRETRERVKVKSDWYLSLHRAPNKVTKLDMLKMVANKTDDDFVSRRPELQQLREQAAQKYLIASDRLTQLESEIVDLEGKERYDHIIKTTPYLYPVVTGKVPLERVIAKQWKRIV